MSTRGTLTSGTSSEGRVSGYVFKIVRESTGRTQQQLAADLRVSTAAIQGWESGRRPLMAMPAGQFLALRSWLRHLGATPALLRTLTQALEADHILGHALATPRRAADPDGHPLGSWVLSRPLTVLTAWPIGAKAPEILCQSSSAASRRGPVPAGPVLSADERRHVVEHLQHVAERARSSDPDGLLLKRQAYYLAGYDSSPGIRQWLETMRRADQARLRPPAGWSPAWPLARSTASALTRAGDPEPMRRFLHDQMTGETAETANLNYWAFWTGELDEQQTSDEFIGSTSPLSWHGGQLVRHLAGRLHGNIGFTELNIRSLHTLIRVRPALARPVSGDLQATITRLLDEDQVSAPARRELETLRYGIAIAHQT
ncbi:MAG: helix-turn-helix domain-containing protein [Streptosporangiaceae bacterium]|nr:helix-turn-helix domain-containing protein [Streptosporangiaceae bacterium]